MTKWISVLEKLPEHEKIVLCKHKSGHKCVLMFTDHNKVKDFLYSSDIPVSQEFIDELYSFASIEISGHTLNNVTHWMELPE
jgi:hypothetical protein